MKWTNIIITDACNQLLRASADLPFRQTGKQLANGDWVVPVQHTTLVGIRNIQMKGETISDCIIRIVNKGKFN